MTRASAVRLLLAFVGGLIAGSACLYLAIRVGATWKGWMTPAPFGLAAVIAYPVGIWVYLTRDRSGREALYTILLLLALACNVSLYVQTDREGWHHFHGVTPYNWLWLSTWLLWQVPILFAAVAAYKKRADEES